MEFPVQKQDDGRGVHRETVMDVRRVIYSLVECQSWEEPWECLIMLPCFIDGEIEAQRREGTGLR